MFFVGESDLFILELVLIKILLYVGYESISCMVLL